jgi:hypothetical protein
MIATRRFVTPTVVHAAVLLATALLATPAIGAAQGMLTAPKAAAQRAAAASNASTAAMQNTGSDQPAAAQAPTQTATGARPHGQMTPITTTATATKPTVVVTPMAKGTTPAIAKAPATAAPATATVAPKATVVTTSTKTVVTTTAKGKPTTMTPPGGDSAARSISVTERGVKGEVSLSREVYSYDPGGRRDPFVSLLRNGDLRPMLSDLRLVVVLYDPTGRNSIAIMRDVSTKDQYRVRVGQTLGRMRVAQIQPKEVVFTIEEVGFSRQEPLALGDSSTARTQ